MVFKKLREEITAYTERDPAAKSRLEVVLCYPGFHASMCHWISRWFWGRNLYILGRFIAYIGRILTGIEIHPGAQIGRGFVIDHGSGVVIGETAVIGENVTLYHDVTLGGVAPSIDSSSQIGQKRHPTLEDGVIVGSGAQILGAITIGAHARVGSNAVVTKDVPGAVTAVGIPAKAVMPRDREKAREFRAYATMTEDWPDPILQTIDALRQEVAALSKKIDILDKNNQLSAEDKDANATSDHRKKAS